MSLSIALAATFALAVRGAPKTLLEMEDATLALESAQQVLLKLNDQRLDLYVGDLTGCKKMSDAFEAKCKDMSCPPEALETEDQYLCCEWDGGPKSCEDADADEVRALTDGVGVEEYTMCCDACRGDDTTNEFKAMCTAERLQGPSVCGTDAEGNEIVDPEVYFREECSTGPSATLNGLDDDCEYDEVTMMDICTYTCTVTRAGFEELVSTLTENEFTEEIYEGMSDAGQDAHDNGFDLIRAYVINGPDVVNKATIEVDMGEDQYGEQCFVILPEPYFAGDLNMFNGDMAILGPIVTPDAVMSMTGGSSAIVVGGINEGQITVTSTGTMEIYDVQNMGDITVTDAEDIFISHVVSSGNILVQDSVVSLYHTENSGEVEFDGGTVHAFEIINDGVIHIHAGEIELEFCVNTGTIDIDEGVTGTVVVPDASTINHPDTVTVTTYTGDACGDYIEANGSPGTRSDGGEGDAAFSGASSLLAPLASSMLTVIAVLLA